MKQSVQYLSPNYFAMVMATDSVSLFESNISGNWLLFVVAIQSIVILTILIASHAISFFRAELNFIALSLWILGGIFFIWIIILIIYRFSYLTFSENDLDPSYFICMGAMAISSLTGIMIMMDVFKIYFFASLIPFIKFITFTFWIIVTTWIPLLAVLAFWKLFSKKSPIGYAPDYWAVVFPLGMYSLNTVLLAQNMNLKFLSYLGLVFFVLSILVWSLTFYGLMHKIFRIIIW
ncbi:tellurite resistance/C4-dicarboxylate transporter family protein [Acidithiobacillus sp. M4-SHS-6]|uniref:tellurite resistance/C4-dicarboxylate transporter family protein n=1 Tax=Acidithiobacillus sp. M4-SHS-6 TaxID=3383024 RepID=UPI0039BDEA1E